MRDKKIVILGAGESGVGAAILSKEKGYHTFVSDGGTILPKYKALLEQNNIDYEESQHTLERVLTADWIIKSPGIPDRIKLIQEIRKAGIDVLSEIEFAYKHTDSKIIAITGSNGKTTTTSLIYHMLRQAGLDVGLVGNIGNSFAYQVAQDNKAIYVLEISSFQLDDIDSFKPDIAVLLNITADHLDRYNYDMNQYIRSKFRIVENQTSADVFIYDEDDMAIKNHMNGQHIASRKIPYSIKTPLSLGGYVTEKDIHVKLNTDNTFTMRIDTLGLQGKHNISNSLAAGIVGKVLGLKKEHIKTSLSHFTALEHRLEPVISVRGVSFINDSKATNVNSAWYALESINKPIIWIAGGVDKGNDYSELRRLVAQKVKAIVCLSKDIQDSIHQAFEDVVSTIVDTHTMNNAVEVSYRLASKGDAVLLSPACASFDLFKNYEDRGNLFKHYVRQL